MGGAITESVLLEDLGVEMQEDAPPPKRWTGMQAHMWAIQAHVGPMWDCPPVLEGYELAVDLCGEIGVDVEDALRSLGRCLEGGWEPAAATCTMCGEAMMDTWTASCTPSRQHRCWCCNSEISTPQSCVVNPLAALLPRRKLLRSSWGI